MQRILTLLVALAAVVFAGGCITDPVTGRSVVGLPVSDAEEEAMGRQYAPAITQEFGGAYPDERLQGHCRDIVLGLARRTVRPELPWTFQVVNTSVPNAFATPGGPVYVTRGLLVEMEDEAEFAVVMGHELGHVEHRHSVQQQGQTLLAAIGAAAVSAKWGDTYGQGAELLSGLGLLHYSRTDESESDVRGVEHAYAAGYDPREGADVFRTFLRLKGGEDAGPTWLSTHPADEDRVRHVLELCAAKDPRLAGTAPHPELKVTTPRWKELIAKLRREHETYKRYDAVSARVSAAKFSADAARAALPEIERCAQELPGHALLVAGAGQCRWFAGDHAGAEETLRRASSMGQGLFAPEYFLALAAHRRNDWDGAVARADRGLQILPGNYLCLHVRGDAHWNAGRRADAERDFRAVVESAPKDSEEYRTAAARLGMTGTAPAAAPAKAPAKGGRRRAR